MDHSLITLTIRFSEESRRNTFWKFNASLLTDIAYLDEINNVIEEVICNYAAFPYDRKNLKNVPLEDISFMISDQTFLDFLLMKIRSKTISFSTYKRKKIEEEEKILVEEIEEFEKRENLTLTEQNLLGNKKDALFRVRQKKMKGVLIRSKARWVEDGEKISSYFCSLEKRNYINKSMNKLIDRNDNVITDKKEIVNEVKSFYSTLYEKKEVENVDIEDLVSNIPRINDQEAESLEGELNMEEISESLNNMANGKSPGSDGFTVDFFKVLEKIRTISFTITK